GDFDLLGLVAVHQRNLHRRAQHRLCVGDRHPAEQVLAVPLEQWMRLDSDVDVQIAAGAALFAGVPLAPQAQLHVAVDPGGDLDRLGDGLLLPAGAVTGFTLVPHDLPCPTTRRTGRLHPEEPLRLDDLTGTAAVVAALGARAGSGPRPVAGLAGSAPGDLDLFRDAQCRFLQRDRHRGPQVSPPAGAASASAAAAAAEVEAEALEDVRELLEDV